MNAWMQRALFLSLSPLLLAQGKYARAMTPRLPEPWGARAGRAGKGPGLSLLIAGDSAAAGVGAEYQQAALSGQLVAALTPHFDLRWQLIAQTGYTTRDLLERLVQEPAQTFDVAVLSLGVNDVTGAVRASIWLNRQRQLVELLQQRFGVQRTVLTSVPPMEKFHALPQPLRTLLGARARRFNVCLEGAITTWTDCELLSMSLPPGPSAIASDGFHPAPSTYRQWALQLAERVLCYAKSRPCQAADTAPSSKPSFRNATYERPILPPQYRSRHRASSIESSRTAQCDGPHVLYRPSGNRADP